MTFYDVSFEEPEDGKFTRTDLQPYRDFLEKLGPGQIATVTVDTGDLIQRKQGKRVVTRGKEEAADERAFRQVAAEQNIGLRITHKIQQNGTTRLRIMKQRKREFTQETLDKRKAALEKRREENRLKKEREAKLAEQQQQLQQPKVQQKPQNPPQKRQG